MEREMGSPHSWAPVRYLLLFAAGILASAGAASGKGEPAFAEGVATQARPAKVAIRFVAHDLDEAVARAHQFYGPGWTLVGWKKFELSDGPPGWGRTIYFMRFEKLRR